MTSTEGASTGAAPLKLTLTYTLGPAGSADTYRMIQDGTLAVAAPGVLANDNNPDSVPAITAVLASLPANGSVSLTPDGSFILHATGELPRDRSVHIPAQIRLDHQCPDPRDDHGHPPAAQLPVAVDHISTVTAGTSTTISVVPPAADPCCNTASTKTSVALAPQSCSIPALHPRPTERLWARDHAPLKRPEDFPRALDLAAPGPNYIDAGDVDKLDGLNEMTLTAWINLRDITRRDALQSNHVR